MCASVLLQAAAQQHRRAAGCQHLETRGGRSPVTFRRHPLPRLSLGCAGIRPQRRAQQGRGTWRAIQAVGRSRHGSGAEPNGKVLLATIRPMPLLGERSGRLTGLGAEEDAAGQPVQAVHHEGRRGAVFRLQVTNELADHRLPNEAVQWGGPEEGGFVHGEDVVVFIQHFQAGGVVGNQPDRLLRPLDGADDQPRVPRVAAPENLPHLLRLPGVPTAVHAEAQPQRRPQQGLLDGRDGALGRVPQLLLADVVNRRPRARARPATTAACPTAAAAAALAALLLGE
mmetsp:Transcript_49052/g.151431  ORF Transcript_49052/g.151431 Transcript_49052/m.151431 type:complete len:284 (-) Transcript_49052:157-1008(-)